MRIADYLIADCGLRIADLILSSIRNPQSAIRNQIIRNPQSAIRNQKVAIIGAGSWGTALALGIETGVTRGEVLLVGIGTPAVMFALYEITCRHYRVFSDVMRSSVDLYRLALLTSLHVERPLSIADERRLWLNLGNAVGFAEIGSIPYHHQKSE